MLEGRRVRAPAQRGLLLCLNPSGDGFILQQKHEGETTLYRKMFFSHPGLQLSWASPLYQHRETQRKEFAAHSHERAQETKLKPFLKRPFCICEDLGAC